MNVIDTVHRRLLGDPQSAEEINRARHAINKIAAELHVSPTVVVKVVFVNNAGGVLV